MDVNKLFVQGHQVVLGFAPVNMASGAPTSDIVSMKNYNRCTILFIKAVGTNGDDPTITVTQKTAVGGTTSKAVNFTRVDKKQGVALNAVGTFTEVTQAAGNTFTHTDLAEQQAIIAIDITGDMLDADNGYDCIQATVADVGTNSQLGCLLYVLSEPRYGADPLPSGIID